MRENRTAPAEPCIDLQEARRRLTWLEYEAHLISRTLARFDVTVAAPSRPRTIGASVVTPAAISPVGQRAVRNGRPLARAATGDDDAPSAREPRPVPIRPVVTPSCSRGQRRAMVLRRSVRRRQLPSWCVSLTVHAALLVLLGVFTVAVIPSDRPMLEASLLDTLDDRLEQLGEVQIEPPDPDVTWTAETLPEAPPAPALATIDPLEPAWEPPSPPARETTQQLGVPGAQKSVAGGGGPPVVKRMEPPTAAPTSFFGTRARADRIVFLVDNSNSMDEGRLETAMLEIGRSVQQLSAKQSFYVIFYSDAVYPMFHPDTVTDLVPATRENKQRLFAWLRSVPMCMGGRLVDAVKAAERLEPQVIFLLSDGVMGDYSVQYLTAARATTTVIHTLGMTVPDMTAARRLAAIALANGGTFRPVGVAPMARRLAVARPIAKLRVRGPVWGRRLPKVTAGR